MSMQRSYEMVGRVLAKCISHGLRSTTISPEEVGITNDDRDEFLHFVDVMKWLKSEGLITTGFETLAGEYSGVQLTSLGIRAIESDRFNGTSVRETVEAAPKGGLGGDTYGKIGSFIGGFVGGLSQSMV